MENQHHEMILEITHASGMQGWYCPTCGRRILLQVPPNDEMVIVKAGDNYASHSGSIGGLRIGPVDVTVRDTDLEDIPEKTLRPWIKALQNLDIDW